MESKNFKSAKLENRWKAVIVRFLVSPCERREPESGEARAFELALTLGLSVVRFNILKIYFPPPLTLAMTEFCAFYSDGSDAFIQTDRTIYSDGSDAFLTEFNADLTL